MMGWDVTITLLVVVPSWAPTIVCALQQPLFGSMSVLRCLDVCLPFEIGIPFFCGPTMIWSVGLRKSTCVFAGTSPAMNIIGFASLISCTTGWCPSSRGTFPTSIVPVTVVIPLGGLLNAWPCALPAMVLGGTSADPVPLETFSRFRVARMAFHRTGRRCQRMFWADWQERLASLSRSCPRVAASMVRRTFSSPSRVDHASRVMWVPPTDLPVAADVSAAHWRQHFSSVGATPRCFDDEFFEEVSQRFHVIDSQPVVPGLFDVPLTPSELGRALTLCFDSAVGIDGLPYSVFKTNLPWWQSAVLTSPILSCLGEWSPLRGSAALWFLSSSVGTRPCPPTFAPFLSPVVASKSSSTWSMRELAPTSPPNSTNVKGVSVGVRTLWLGLSSTSHITVLLAHFCGFRRHAQSL